MGLNAKNAPSAGAKRVEQPLIDVGGCPARVVQIIDLGLQPESYQGEEKAPCREISVTYELVDEFCVDEEGNIQEDKPRWLSERFCLKNLKAEKAKSTLRYNAIDPAGKHDGDFTALIGEPCVVNVVHNAGSGKNAGKTYNNVGSVSAIRPKDAGKIPPLVNKPTVFLTDEPDAEVFNSLPEFIREIIKNNLEFNGSALQKVLGGKPAAKAAPAPEPDEEEGEEDWRDE